MFNSFHGNQRVKPSDLLNTTLSSQSQEMSADTFQCENEPRLGVNDTLKEGPRSDTDPCSNGVCSLNWSPVKQKLGS